MADMESYLRCTEIVDCDTEQIVAKAQELTKGFQTNREKAVALFYFVRDEIKHDPYATGMEYNRYKASLTLESGQGLCSH
ncbi:MAG: transglutaminase domain-containing protein [Dehalococcoidia bacterium]|nr:MAG: transglutaminase domain-containing protein [Dehalococcoidia bacterium]